MHLGVCVWERERERERAPWGSLEPVRIVPSFYSIWQPLKFVWPCHDHMCNKHLLRGLTVTAIFSKYMFVHTCTHTNIHSHAKWNISCKYTVHYIDLTSNYAHCPIQKPKHLWNEQLAIGNQVKGVFICVCLRHESPSNEIPAYVSFIVLFS